MYMNNLLEADGLAYFGARANGLYLCMPCDVQFNYSLGHTDALSATQKDVTN